MMLFPPGHFYSPIADPDDIRAREGSIWSCDKEMPGVDFNESGQLALLTKLASYVCEIAYPVEQSADPTRYFYSNDQFPVLDAEVLFAMLCYLKPKQMIEVGSGFSSLVTADVNRRILNGGLEFSCIEPYPRQFLVDGVEGISSLIVKKVEDVEPNYFDRLDSGDILFIDSSHVTKIGSDVNHLFFEILPRLRVGTLVHIHDIFLPDEYPKVWMLDQGRNWNEQYLVRAFLQFNDSFEVVWAANFMARYHFDRVTQAFPRFPSLGGGGSLWLRKIR
jgi:predicted O-methyltransferase YrrM